MKLSVFFRFLFYCIIICGINTSFAQKFKPKYLRENDKAILALTSNATEDGWLEFKSNEKAVDVASFSAKFASNLGMGDGYSVQLVSDKTDIKETRHQHYQLYYKKIAG